MENFNKVKRDSRNSHRNAFVSFFLFLLFFSCKNEKPTFKEWYSNLPEKENATAHSIVHKRTFLSNNLLIDTIFRSMQGPFEIKAIELENKEELIWITGYSSEVIDSDNDTVLPTKFMCHNNLNYGNIADVPWSVKTLASNNRIFTLSEGQTSFSFPEGFGLPAISNQKFTVMSQVLNHSVANINLNTKHRFNIDYVKESEVANQIKPLYQQSIFVTKQVEGPSGEFGSSLSCKLENHSLRYNNLDSLTHDCSIVYETEKYNPYADGHGRIFTGHWKLPTKSDTITTNVSKMLNLQEDSRIHAIGIHVHPFAKLLALWDKTDNKLVYEAKFKEKADVFGFDTIAYYKSKAGIQLYADHNYELKSIYHCTDSLNNHSAMAVMYLYLSE